MTALTHLLAWLPMSSTSHVERLVSVTSAVARQPTISGQAWALRLQSTLPSEEPMSFMPRRSANNRFQLG